MWLPDHAHPHHQVHFLCNQVHDAVVELHFQLQLRIARGEFRQGGDEQRPAEYRRYIDPQASLRRQARAPQRLVGAVELGEDALAACQVLHPVTRESDLARGAMEQLAAQVLLELCNVGTDYGAGDAQRIRRPGEGVQVRHPHEAAHAHQLIHAGIVLSLVNNKFVISLFLEADAAPRVTLRRCSMFIFNRPFGAVAAGIGFALLVVVLSGLCQGSPPSGAALRPLPRPSRLAFTSP